MRADGIRKRREHRIELVWVGRVFLRGQAAAGAVSAGEPLEPRPERTAHSLSGRLPVRCSGDLGAQLRAPRGAERELDGDLELLLTRERLAGLLDLDGTERCGDQPRLRPNANRELAPPHVHPLVLPPRGGSASTRARAATGLRHRGGARSFLTSSAWSR